MKQNLVRCVVLPLMLAASMAPALAQWKWKDGKGQIQYSDVPPPRGTPERDILQRPEPRLAALPAAASASGAAPAASAAKGDPTLEAARRKAEEADAAKRKAEEERAAAQRAENCERARSQLRLLDNGGRIARVNEKGEREVMSDAARTQEAARARAVVATECR